MESASSNSPRASPTAAFRNAMGSEIDCAEDTARNSNLFPVKAKGEVRLRSVWSRATSGSLRMPRLIVSMLLAPPFSFFSIASRTRVS
jgi:hypothetical protein